MPSLGELGAAEAEAAETPEPTTFDFHGRTFTLRDHPGVLPVMKFAAAAEDHLSLASMEGLAVTYKMIRASIIEADWPRFEQAASEVAAESEELLDVASEIIIHLAGRPTVRPSASSDGPPATTENSKDTSSSQAARLGLVPVDEALASSA